MKDYNLYVKLDNSNVIYPEKIGNTYYKVPGLSDIPMSEKYLEIINADLYAGYEENQEHLGTWNDDHTKWTRIVDVSGINDKIKKVEYIFEYNNL